jgi:hypothetical protein
MVSVQWRKVCHSSFGVVTTARTFPGLAEGNEKTDASLHAAILAAPEPMKMWAITREYGPSPSDGLTPR